MLNFILLFAEWPAIAGHFSSYGLGLLWLMLATLVALQIGRSAELSAVRHDAKKSMPHDEDNGMLLFFAPSDDSKD